MVNDACLSRKRGGGLFSIGRRIRRAGRLLRSALTGRERCEACGFRGAKQRVPVVSDELADQWKLTDEWRIYFDAREGVACVRCGCNERASHQAAAVLDAIRDRVPVTGSSLAAAMRDSRAWSLRIAEINSAHGLHQFLRRSANVVYSEFGSRDPAVPSEDLLALTYGDACFDIVITSETLEHVPDCDRANHEILRVLKPGGVHVFTVPVVWDGRRTVQRARVEAGTLCHLLPPSYHGGAEEKKEDFLVFYEFGDDVVERCRSAGFDIIVRRDPLNPALATFMATKPPAR